MIAFSTICYTHGKIMGMAPAVAAIEAMIQGRQINGVPPPGSVRVAQALGRLYGASERVGIRTDPGGSSLGKSRARAFHWADECAADVWLSCDDDVECSDGTLARLVSLLQVEEPRVICAPCALREGDTQDVRVNIVPEPDAVREGNLLPIKLGGFGLVGVNRAAILAIKGAVGRFQDDDGVFRPLVFHDVVDGEQWWGEDFSFFLQLPPTVRRYALVSGSTTHAGIVLELERVAELVSPLSHTVGQ